jgi:drug/metabolite transporter (DMT)-like permease
MMYLIGSVVLSSYLTLAFKMCQRFNIPLFQAIVFNYITCVITGSIVNKGFPINTTVISQSWFHWALLMGVLFITIFNIIGITAQKNGVAVASVANKLSLIIPVILSLWLYNESLGGIKLVGVLLALVAVVFTCYPSAKKGDSHNSSSILLPIILFVGSGFLDALINHVQKNHVNSSNSNAYLISGFFSAGCIGVLVLLYSYATKKMAFSIKPLIAGILIGVPNYFSIWCLVHYLKTTSLQSNASIPINNMGIVLFSSIMAFLLFKEKLSNINWIGVALSIIAILLIAFGGSIV